MLSMKHNEYGVLNQETSDFLYAAEREFMDRLKVITDNATQVELRLLAQHVECGISISISELILMKTCAMRKPEREAAKKAMEERLSRRKENEKNG
jgi:hypothetical protein